MKLIKIIAVLGILIIVGCNSHSSIENYEWKYGEGYHIGDFIEFKKPTIYEIDDSNRIFVDKKHIADVVDCSARRLTIKSSSTGRTGLYFRM
jgi:hypothetical protein